MAVEIQPLDVLFPCVLFHSQAHEPQLNGKMDPFLKITTMKTLAYMAIISGLTLNQQWSQLANGLTKML